MTNREFEVRYRQMKLTWKNLVNANVELVDENKMLKEEIEKLNNIMRKLEIEIYAKYHEYKDSECEELYAKAQEDKEILDYIKELKGSE